MEGMNEYARWAETAPLRRIRLREELDAITRDPFGTETEPLFKCVTVTGGPVRLSRTSSGLMLRDDFKDDSPEYS
jgi:hypothetical protein